MTLPDRLAQLVAAAPAALVQPDRPRLAPAGVSPPLRLAAALGLGHGRWITVICDAAGARWTVPLIEEPGRVRRAIAGDGAAESLVALLCQGQCPEPGFELRRWSGAPVQGERALAPETDQTNESVIVGPHGSEQAAVVKWLVHQPRRGEAAEHPAVRRLTTLALAGFDGTPAPWGLLTCDAGEAAPLLLATVAAYLPDARDGWDWAVRDVRQLAGGALSPRRALAPATALGELTARLHAALAPGGQEIATERAARAWSARAQADLDLAVSLVDGPEGGRLATLAPRLAAEIAALAGLAGTPLIDVHGDLHVGQVLRYGTGPSYAINDFDGNPVLPPAERASRQPAALDVAGMLASLDHVGRIVLHRDGDAGAAAVERWIDDAQAAFLAAYRSGLARNGLAWLLDERLIRPLRVRQECREYLYAVRHLPDWRYVPDLALSALFRNEND